MRAQTVERKWAEMSGAVPQRDAKLQAELARQQENERLRAQFASKANVAGPWLERHLEGAVGATSKARSLLSPLAPLLPYSLHRYIYSLQFYTLSTQYSA